MDLWQPIWIAAAIAGSLMFLLWVLEVIRRDAGVVDVGWSFSIGIIVVIDAITVEGDLVRRCVVGALGGIWAFRLGFYLLLNRVIGKSEDGRYQALRQRWGRKAHLLFFWFFQAQALLAVLFSLPFLVGMSNTPSFGSWSDYVGVAIWLVAIGGEAMADAQLARFRGQPVNRGQVCQVGLWRYSRHPNYFFEWLHWWAYPLLALGADYFWLTLVAPLLMLFFLFKVTGIPYTELQAVKSRGDAYRRYQRTTNVFIPWPPRTERT